MIFFFDFGGQGANDANGRVKDFDVPIRVIRVIRGSQKSSNRF